jgi:hypothetical protein
MTAPLLYLLATSMMVRPLSPVPASPAFRGAFRPLPSEVRALMEGVSWFPACPLSLDDLALLELSHWGFDGAVHEGRLVVASQVARPVLAAFRALYEARFPIERMEPVDAYGGDDERSMAANNSSGFNCRRVMGESRWSMHAYGTAIDLNPVQNPYLKAGRVYPPAASAYLDRTQDRPGMVRRGGPAHRAFRDIGWKWGGLWRRVKDYQHFSANGR